MTFFGHYTEEEVEQFREAYAGDSALSEGGEDGDANYECQKCDNKRYIDDYKMHASSYCTGDCEEVRPHRRIE